MAEDIHIAVNRGRLLFQIMLFSGLGIGALIGGFALAEFSSINPLVWKGMGIVFCVLLILTAGAKAKQRTNKKAGITLGKEGILDHSTDISVGLIKWNDIQGVDKEACQKFGLVVVKVRRMNDYVKKAKNAAVERLLNQNIRNFDTPIVIEPKYLECTLEELVDMIQDRIKNKK